MQSLSVPGLGPLSLGAEEALGLQDQPTTGMVVSSAGSSTAPSELSDLVLQALVVNKGVAKAASEWLYNKHGVQLASYELVDHLHGRLPELKEKMELVAVLDLFSLMPTLQQAVTSQIGDLSPAEATRSYMDLMKLVQTSTSKNELNINVHEEIWTRAPRNLKSLFAQLEAAGQLDLLDDPTIIDHDSEDQVA